MPGKLLRDEQWERIKDWLPGKGEGTEAGVKAE